MIVPERATASAGREPRAKGAHVGISRVQPSTPALTTAARKAASPGWYRQQGDTSNTVFDAQVQVGDRVVPEVLVLVGVG